MKRVTKKMLESENGKSMIENRLKEAYGTTSIVSHGGYVLVDGTMLDFMEPSTHRIRPLSDIDRFMRSTDGSSNAVRFMLRGNMRMKQGKDRITIELMEFPTSDQVNTLRKIKRSAKASGKKFTINLLGPHGYVMDSTDNIDDIVCGVTD